MQYMLLIYDDEKNLTDMSPEEHGTFMAEYGQFTQWLKEKGAFVAGDALEPVGTATTVRVRAGDRSTTDGPFAETVEQLGGYYLVEAENLDEAIEMAAKIPSARIGSIEIRPVMVFSP